MPKGGKKKPTPPVDPTPSAGETATLRQDADFVYLDCKGFNQPMINCHIETDPTGDNPSTMGCAVALYSTDTDGDGNLTFQVPKAAWFVPNVPRVVSATAWDTDDVQHVDAEPITIT